MNYDEFKRHVGKAGLTLTELADLLNMNKRSVTNYGAGGVVPDSLAVIVVLMGEMADAGMDFRPAIARIGMKRKLERGVGFGEKNPVGFQVDNPLGFQDNNPVGFKTKPSRFSLR